jgi:hypothetical protein
MEARDGNQKGSEESEEVRHKEGGGEEDVPDQIG